MTLSHISPCCSKFHWLEKTGLDLAFDIFIKSNIRPVTIFYDRDYMMISEHSLDDTEFNTTLSEIRNLACTLEGLHGVHAYDVAEFFAEAHGQEGDRGRLRAWTTVAGLIRQREHERLG